ncbi:MAG: hypothetical protein NT154_06690, partial [Verrucomicrobia bacterium]|nr:hypothetical protein [Verrucomicrobiota bacterium]
MPTTQIRALTYSTVTVNGATVPFTNLVNTLGTTFTYLNGGKIIFPPIVDFVVTDLRAPQAAPAGQFAEVVWTVKNQNTTNTASGERNDAVYLSKDHTIGNDTFLAHFPSAEPLGPGESRTYTNLVILPGGLSGNYYFVVAADSLYQFYEGSGEANNSAIASNVISIASVDLVAPNFTVTNATAQFGQMLWVTWTVRNTGTTNAAGWSDRVYLSSANRITAESIALCPPLSARNALAAGASYTNTTHVTLPLYAGLPAGNYYLVVTADCANSLPESNETNNWASRLVSVSIPPLPDLVVAQVLAPTMATAGQTIDLALAVTNQGTASVTQQWTGLISITNAALGRHDLTLFDFTNALSVGALVWHTQAVVVPTHNSAGATWFQVAADFGKSVVEKDEGNNVGTATNATQVPLQLTLEVPFTQIAENAAQPSVLATVIRNGSLDQPLTVNLASSDTNELIVPPSVTIPARGWNRS